MIETTPYFWALDDRRFRTRVATISRMTKVDESHQSFMDDLGCMAAATRDFAIERQLDWDPYFSHEVVPAWREGQQPHTEDEIVRTNRSALSASDGLIAHAFDDGSGSFGDLLRMMLESGRNVPVLIVAHEKELLSKYLLGLERRYRRMTITRFSGSLEVAGVVEDWLSANLSKLESGPDKRRRIEDHWKAFAVVIRQALKAASAEQLMALEDAIPYTRIALEEMLDDLTPCDDATLIMMRVMQVLEIDPEHVQLRMRARILERIELQAWREWSAGVPTELALTILRAVIEERESLVVGKTPDVYAQSGMWQNFARRWTNGQA